MMITPYKLFRRPDGRVSPAFPSSPTTTTSTGTSLPYTNTLRNPNHLRALNDSLYFRLNGAVRLLVAPSRARRLDGAYRADAR